MSIASPFEPAGLTYPATPGCRTFDSGPNPVIDPSEATATQVHSAFVRTALIGIPTTVFGKAVEPFLQGEATTHLDTLEIRSPSRGLDPWQDRRTTSDIRGGPRSSAACT